MRHAGKDALDRLEPLLSRIRSRPDLVERRRGIFYRRSRAFLHFHEDAEGLFADVRLKGEDFDRFALRDPKDEEALLALIDRHLQE